MSSSRDNSVDEIDPAITALRYATVADLKQLIISLNKHCVGRLSRTGNKQVLIDRITATLRQWKQNGDATRWNGVRPTFHQLRLLRSDPKAASSTLPANHTHVGQIAAAPAPPAYRPEPFRFKLSPFFTVTEAVSTVFECPESYSSSDRREATFNFQLNSAQLAKISTPNSGYQIRLFCTSSNFYLPHRATNPELPIEFPGTCEVFINDVQIKASLLKGMKKTPGTAPPPDLAVGSLRAVNNIVKMVYINHAPQGQQTEFKKFYLVVQLVQMHRVSTLVHTLRTTRSVPAEDVRRQMVCTMTSDDDIIAGTLKLPLKCPLSFGRIALPCRSSKCTHSQCFDAASWYAVMEQTTTWLCPICENVLDWRELIIDGFFADILRLTPPSVDDVLLEADGTWRTPDGRYSSTNPFSASAKPEVISLDSDDD
ncbi:PINIT domain-containing protein [Mycena amicta]|nr:PINIT domain-containing protein [Mycena amicta]